MFLALAFVYYSVFPLMLNLALSFGAAVLLARNRGILVWLTLFLVTSLLLTFATRLPDFICDAISLPETERSIIQPRQLLPGDTVNLGEHYLPIEHRTSYFGTPGYEGSDMRVGIAGPNFYKEDIVYLLEGMGLRLNFGQPLAGAPVITLNVTETETHQQLELKVSEATRQVAWYRSRNRMHFTDELGAGSGPYL